MYKNLQEVHIQRDTNKAKSHECGKEISCESGLDRGGKEIRVQGLRAEQNEWHTRMKWLKNKFNFSSIHTL